MQNIEKHYSDTLKKIMPIHSIDLGKVAKSSDRNNLMMIVELIVGAILSSSEIAQYISKLRELNEKDQSELMVFIQKIIKKLDEADQGEQDMYSVKQENRVLKVKIEELNTNLLEIASNFDALLHEKNELLTYKKHLEESIETRSLRRLPTELNLPYLESEINKKDAIVHELLLKNQEWEKRYEEDISQIKDELDIANEKLLDYNNMKSNVERYKKHIEDMSTSKKKLQEVQLINQKLVEELKGLEKDYTTVANVQAQLRTSKELLDAQKHKSERLEEELEKKEKMYKEVVKTNKENEDARIFFEAQTKELTFELDRLRFSTEKDDELVTLDENIHQDLDDQMEKLKKNNYKLLMNSGIVVGLNQKLDETMVEKERLKQQAKEENNVRIKLEKQVEELKENINNLNQKHTEKLHDLENTHKISHQTEQKLLHKIDEMHNQINKLNTKLSLLKKTEDDQQSFTKHLKSVYDQKDSLYTELECLKDTNFKLQSELCEKIEALTHLQVTLNKCKQELEESVKTQNKCKAELKLYEDSLPSELVQIRETNMMNEINALKSEIKEKNEEIERLVNEKSSSESLNASITITNTFSAGGRLSMRLDSECCESERVSENGPEKYNEELVDNWNREMKIMSAVIHEVGMECMKTGQLLNRKKRLENVF